MTRIDYNYYLDTPDQQKRYFYKRAKFKNRLVLFAAIMVVIGYLLRTGYFLYWFGFTYRYFYIRTAVWLIAAAALFVYYRNKRKLITCYDELMREVENPYGQGNLNP